MVGICSETSNQIYSSTMDSDMGICYELLVQYTKYLFICISISFMGKYSAGSLRWTDNKTGIHGQTSSRGGRYRKPRNYTCQSL